MLKNEHMSLFKGTFGLGNIFFLSKLFKDLSLHSRGSALVWGAPRLIQQIKEHGKFAPWLKGRLSEDSFRRSRMNSHVFFAKTFLQGRDHIYEIKIVKWTWCQPCTKDVPDLWPGRRWSQWASKLMCRSAVQFWGFLRTAASWTLCKAILCLHKTYCCECVGSPRLITAWKRSKLSQKSSGANVFQFSWFHKTRTATSSWQQMPC